MMASIAITAAEPHGLLGLLQESFAGGAELAKAKWVPRDGLSISVKDGVVDLDGVILEEKEREALRALSLISQCLIELCYRVGHRGQHFIESDQRLTMLQHFLVTEM